MRRDNQFELTFAPPEMGHIIVGSWLTSTESPLVSNITVKKDSQLVTIGWKCKCILEKDSIIKVYRNKRPQGETTAHAGFKKGFNLIKCEGLHFDNGDQVGCFFLGKAVDPIITFVFEERSRRQCGSI